MEWHVALIPALIYVGVIAGIIYGWVKHRRAETKLTEEDYSKFEELLKKAAEEE